LAEHPTKPAGCTTDIDIRPKVDGYIEKFTLLSQEVKKGNITFKLETSNS
jgi:hypothetical protein